MSKKIEELTITEGLTQLLYYTSTTMDLLINRTDAEIRKSTGGLAHFRHQIKQYFSEMAKAMKRYQYYSDRVDDMFIEVEDAVKNHDSRLEGANEICRLILLYYDRCGNNDEAGKKVFDLLKGMPTSGVFTNEFIEKFRMK